MAVANAIDRVPPDARLLLGGFAACLIPGVIPRVAVLYGAARSGTNPDALGPDPVKETLHTTGRYAITLVLLALTVTPARRFLSNT